MSQYEVVFPLGRRAKRTGARAVRPRSLDGVTIAELSNDKFDAGFVFETIEKALLKRVPTAKFISHKEFGNTYGNAESDVIRDLPGRLKQHGADVVISGLAG